MYSVTVSVAVTARVAGITINNVCYVCMCWYTGKTTIVAPPANQTVNVGSNVTLQCNATTDPLTLRRLKISWLLNGEKIEFGSHTNVAQTSSGALTITQVQTDNRGSYTCNASTDLDWDAVTVRLTVRGTMISASSVRSQVARHRYAEDV